MCHPGLGEDESVGVAFGFEERGAEAVADT